jgi:hypothetical protein
MLESLDAVAQGKMQAPKDDELFDPLPDTPKAQQTAPAPRQIFADPRTFALAALGIAALGTAAFRLASRRKKT